MGKRKVATETVKERASVSRERRIALALRALLDANVGMEHEQEAIDVLNELGYSTLESIPKRVKELNEQLTQALAAGDGALIAKLGTELSRVKAGRVSKVVAGASDE